jgi:hypothetical protein
MRPTVIVSLLGVLLLSGCGLNVTSADLFVLTRTGPGSTLKLLVNDGGTIRCNGGRTRSLSNPLLLRARDLASSLDKDVKGHLTLRAKPNTVYTYRVELQDGTLTFPDTAASGHKEIAQAELFTVQAAQSACGITA